MQYANIKGRNLAETSFIEQARDLRPSFSTVSHVLGTTKSIMVKSGK
jgi:hypothetical protein